MSADTLLAIAAIITAAAGLVKAFYAGKDIKALTTKVEQLERENQTLREKLTELTRENDDLREQNNVLAGVNKEYREQLFPALRRK